MSSRRYGAAESRYFYIGRNGRSLYSPRTPRTPGTPRTSTHAHSASSRARSSSAGVSGRRSSTLRSFPPTKSTYKDETCI